MAGNDTIRITVFYCHHVSGGSEAERQEIERTWGNSIRCFPLSCSGRFEHLHLLKSLEEGSAAVFLITCPDGECRHFVGNRRAHKRLAHAQKLLAEIGLDEDRAGIVMSDGSGSLSALVEELMGKAVLLGPLETSGQASDSTHTERNDENHAVKVSHPHP